MGGGCRESTAFWRNGRGFRRELREIVLHPLRRRRRRQRWPLPAGSWSEFWGDNLGPIVCWWAGHREYNTALAHEPAEIACRRCHRWVWRAPQPPGPNPNAKRSA